MHYWIVLYIFARAIEFQFNSGLVAPTECYSSTLTEIAYKTKAYYLHLDKLNKEHSITLKLAFLFYKLRPYASIN